VSFNLYLASIWRAWKTGWYRLQIRVIHREKLNKTSTDAHPCAGRHRASWILFLLVLLAVLATDLVSKTLAFELVAPSPVRLTDSVRLGASPIPPHEAIPLIPSILSLKLTLNTGAIFGLGKGRQWFFIAVSMVAVLVLIRVFWVSRAQARVIHVALAMILAGAIGNLYDRVRFNAVRDLLWLFPEVKLPFGWRWSGGSTGDQLYPWIFNVADAGLVVGVVLMLVVMWSAGPREPVAGRDPD